MQDRQRHDALISLSSAGRRLSDLVSAAGAPVRYEVLRHLLRVSEETMTEVLEEVVELRLVRRGDDPFTYLPYDDATAHEITEALGPEREQRLRTQIEGAARRVFET
jgi:hypothetical protein